MATQKSATVRYKSRPSPRVPFRDDTSLVALRYELTTQAELPIIQPPPRNPLRATRRSFSSNVSATGSPVVVVAPPPILPQEQHPAFRTRPAELGRCESDSWKRDSGLAATTSISSGTIREESECDLVDQVDQESAAAVTIDEAPSPVTFAQVRFSTDSHPSSCYSQRFQSLPSPPLPAQCAESACGPFSPEAAPSLENFVPASRSATSESRRASHDRPREGAAGLLAKTFSFRAGSSLSKRLRKKKSVGSSSDWSVAPTRTLQSQGSAFSTNATSCAPSSNVTTDTTAYKHTPSFWPMANRGKHEPTSPRPSTSVPEADCTPILTTAIPTDGFLEDGFLSSLSFSKRGSLMFGGKRAIGGNGSLFSSPMENSMENSVLDAEATSSPSPSQSPPAPSTTPANATAIAEAATIKTPSTEPERVDTTYDADSGRPSQGDRPKILSVPDIRVMSVDVERESQKVRSLYESGEGIDWQDGGQRLSFVERLEPTEEVPSDEEEHDVLPAAKGHLSPSLAFATPRSASLSLRRGSPGALRRSVFELAGGLEDWQDVEGSDVDRYGFIHERRPDTRATTPETRSSPLVPRGRRTLTKRPGSATYNSSPLSMGRIPSRKVSARSLHTVNSEFSTTSVRSSRSSIRAATNRLPHNRDRRWMDEAGDMLSLAPGLADIAEDEQSEKISEALKRKEWERSEKWRKMAKVIKKGRDGQGMDFEFDMKNPKLIDRTWKGIPDRWRGAAWYSFLATSAKSVDGASAAADEHLIAEYHRLQTVGSPDDVQIDLDVPRTINRHIMFRRRYRGGQRLLFRVLHAVSIYFPETGYVQGMASLAATMLCYYDEERSFVMLARMWKYRGLEHIYRPGFGELMAALEQFEKCWMAGKDVAKKLSELGIDPTAYGTRWYLTLFSLSLPFPAQLRVWDVYMLLGDPAPSPQPAGESGLTKGKEKEKDKEKGEGEEEEKVLPPTRPPPPPPPPVPRREFEVLHATAAALMHALRDVLLDSDFENAMKALTSWVPVKDEEMLMKVTRAEWKIHQGRRKG